MRYIEVRDIIEFIGKSRALALPGFHAFTGSDTTASFFNRGKKQAWDLWNIYPAATILFKMLSTPINDSSEYIVCESVLHGFVNRLYGMWNDMTVDDARLRAVVFEGKDFLNIPPSSDALHQKLLRAAHQSGHVWGNMFQRNPIIPPASSWGFVQPGPDDIPRPLWITKPILSRKHNKELSACGCQSSGECKPPCICCKNNQTCTTFCGCNGMCLHTQNVSKELTEALGELDSLK